MEEIAEEETEVMCSTLDLRGPCQSFHIVVLKLSGINCTAKEVRELLDGALVEEAETGLYVEDCFNEF